MALVTQATHCGETPLLNALKTGAIIFLKSKSTGRNLRIRDGVVEGTGGEGELAKFTVYCHGDGVVAFQNFKNPESWIRTMDGQTTGNGNGGEFCNYIAHEHDGFLVFESQKHRGQHIGVLPDGTAKPPHNTGTGEHARFYPTIFTERPEVIVSDRSNLKSNFAQGNIIVLTSKASGKTLRVNNGTVEGIGGKGKLAQFLVHVRGRNLVSLQNLNDRDGYLRIHNNKLDTAYGGSYTVFEIKEVDGFITLESVYYRGQHVGILPNGQAKPPGNTGTGEHGRFFPEVLEENPRYNRVGDSILQRTLTHGNHVVLYSKASKKTLRVHENGSVDGIGGEGSWATYIVHVIQPGVVALQNKHNTNRWVWANGANLTIGPDAHKDRHLKVKEVDGHLVFESLHIPGTHVGIKDDGSAKPPQNTGTGNHARFYPKVKENSPWMTYLAGRGRLERQFIQGSTIILESKASGRSLKNHDQRIDGTGGSGKFAQWIVCVRGPGVVALQSVAHPDQYLAIRDGQLTTGNGGRFTSLLVKEVDGYVALESQLSEGQHVGVKPDGSSKPPGNTGTGDHGRFTPKLA